MGEVLHEVKDGLAVVRLRGGFTLASGVQAVTEAIVDAIAKGHAALLVDLTDIRGVASPGIGERHWLMTEWAKAGRGAIRVALWIRPELADPDHFGTSVAISRGFDARGFRDLERALEWLQRSSD